jgi:hypothetical protein
MREARNEMAYMIFACFACLGMLHGLGLHIQTLDLVFIVGAIIAALILLVASLRDPRRLVLLLIGIPLMAFLGYGLVRGIFWYFMTYLPSKGESLFKFGP